ncbi:hypothetical protein JWG39_14610 [Desulforhopalus vacuolatus]|nr:hypothetical protein [Desulforhopalus vacuolatus]MBM9521050.1 hypothetical protein [Desulforhopalus vacuolatus]
MQRHVVTTGITAGLHHPGEISARQWFRQCCAVDKACLVSTGGAATVAAM